MTVKEFVEKYNNLASETLKNDMINKSIVLSYLNYEDKCDMCQRIIKATTYKTVGDKQIYSNDSTARYMLFMLELINHYTKIDIDLSNVLQDFNDLDRYGLVDKIISSISETEITKMNTILKMKLDDFRENNRSLVSYIDLQMDKMNFITDATLNAFSGLANSEKNEDVQLSVVK